MRWWSSRGPQTSFKRDEEAKLLLSCAAQWGRRVVHVFDQGFAGGLWLGLLLALGLRFVLRWRKDYQLVDAQGTKRKAWHIARGKRGSRDRLLWESRRARWVQASVLVLSVHHAEQPEVALSLLLCRSAGRLPWYLLTNEAVANEEEAWQVVFASVRRWQIEQTWRYDKSELADHQSTSVALGGTRETLADGFVSLCLSLEPARAVLRLLAAVALAPLLSPHWLALPPSQSPALSAAQRPLARMAAVSAQLRQACATTTAKHATPGHLRPRGQQVTPFPHWKGTAGAVGEECPGEAISFYQAKDVKTVSLYMSPSRAANEGGESPSFSSSFPWAKERNLICCEIAFLCYDPFPLSSSLSLKIRDDSCCSFSSICINFNGTMLVQS